MKKFIAFILPLLISAYNFGQTEIKPLAIGSTMPLQNHELKDAQGKGVRFGDLMGSKGLVVIFSCNTCPFVVGGKSFEGWEKNYNGLHDLASKIGINLVLINSNEAKRENGDSMEDMKKRASELGYKMPYLYDYKSVVADAFGAKTTPHVFFFNKDFNLVYTGSIDNQMEQNKKRHVDYLMNAMNSINNGKKVRVNSTPPIGCSIKRQ
jgi:hypothetical protein